MLRNPAYEFGPKLVIEPSGVPNTVMYGGLSRSTRNISLEMNTEEGRALFRRLVAVADVVIENFGAETMPHWDCSFDDLLAVNPRLVMVSLSGYGRTGPRSSYLAYATNISNFSGLTSTWQYQHGTHSDYIAAIHATIGALAAIAQSDQTDSGVYIDVAQTEALAAVMAPIYLDPLNNGRDTPPTGNTVPGSLFTGAFACQGHDRWLAIELEDVSDWSTLCEAIERPDLAIDDAIAKLTADAAISPTRCRRGRRSVRRTPPRSCCRTSGSPPARCTTTRTRCAIRSCVHAVRASRSTTRISG